MPAIMRSVMDFPAPEAPSKPTAPVPVMNFTCSAKVSRALLQHRIQALPEPRLSFRLSAARCELQLQDWIAPEISRSSPPSSHSNLPVQQPNNGERQARQSDSPTETPRAYRRPRRRKKWPWAWSACGLEYCLPASALRQIRPARAQRPAPFRPARPARPAATVPCEKHALGCSKRSCRIQKTWIRPARKRPEWSDTSAEMPPPSRRSPSPATRKQS